MNAPTAALMESLTGWHTPVPDDHPAAALLTAASVRASCQPVFDYVAAGYSGNFQWKPEQLPACARYVAETIRSRYPDLKVPYHSRWRHFEAGSVDRWTNLVANTWLCSDPFERARVAFDLVIPSVLLDAGAGPSWRYLDAASGDAFMRSEGLGVASFNAFAAGMFSATPGRALRSDAQALAALETVTLAAALQASPENDLIGVGERTALLRRLGEVAIATPAVFGTPARLGNLFDYLLAHADGMRIEAGFVLATLLRAIGPVWPAGAAVGGVALGDAWPHPALADGPVTFHKLSQWLTYSLLEPLEDAGLTVTGLDALTGLPEYRNGGLLLDFEIIVPRRPQEFIATRWTVDDSAIVEWRALTVIGLDLLAEAVRAELGVVANAFPLARVLEGGTWAAGRRIAAERRPGGTPPLQIMSDGTVF